MPQPPRPIVIGLTGSMGSGKSCVAAYLQELGAAVIDADQLARQAVQPGSTALAEICTAFGKSVLLPSGELDRKALAQLVFPNSEQRRRLEGILHPEIRIRCEQLVNTILQSATPPRLIVCVIPLLFETKFPYPWIDRRVTVSAPAAKRLERVIQRDHCTPAAALERMNAQLPQEQKEKLADYVIRNESSLEDLKASTAQFYLWACQCSS